MAKVKGCTVPGPGPGPAAGPIRGPGPYYWYDAWVVWVLLLLVLAFAFVPRGYWW